MAPLTPAWTRKGSTDPGGRFGRDWYGLRHQTRRRRGQRRQRRLGRRRHDGLLEAGYSVDPVGGDRLERAGVFENGSAARRAGRTAAEFRRTAGSHWSVRPYATTAA